VPLGAADELYGDTPSFREGVAHLGKWYFTEVARSTLICAAARRWSCRASRGIGAIRPAVTCERPTIARSRVDEVVAHIPKEAWLRATIKEGSKGPIVCDFAFLRITEPVKDSPAQCNGWSSGAMWTTRLRSRST